MTFVGKLSFNVDYIGNFSFIEAYYGDDSQEGSEKDSPTDEDADVDESEEEAKKKANEQVHFES